MILFRFFLVLLTILCAHRGLAATRRPLPHSIETPVHAPSRTIDFPGGQWSNIVCHDGYLYAISTWESAGDLAVFDIRDAGDIRFVASLHGRGGFSERPVFLGDVAYVCDSSGVAVIDITRPDAPMLVRTIDHGRLDGHPRRVAIAGEMLLVLGGTDVVLYDASDPFAPVLIDHLSMPCAAWSEKYAVVREAKELYAIFEITENGFVRRGAMSLSEYSGCKFIASDVLYESDRRFTRIHNLKVPCRVETMPLTDSRLNSIASPVTGGRYHSFYDNKLTEWDVRNPLKPKVARKIVFPENLSREIWIQHSVCFLLSSSSKSIRAYSIASTNAVLLCERPFCSSASSIAVRDGCAVIYGADFDRSQLLSLDVASPFYPLHGQKRAVGQFARSLVIPHERHDGELVPFTERYTGDIRFAGDNLIFNNGLAALDERGALCSVTNRTFGHYDLADSQHYAFAQSSHCRIARVINATNSVPSESSLLIVDNYIPKIPAEITSAVVRGTNVFVISSSYDDSGVFLETLAIGKTNVVRLARIKIKPAVVCDLVADRFLYIPGVNYFDEDGVAHRGEFTIVDVANPVKPRIVAVYSNWQNSSSFRAKYANGRFFYLDEEAGIRMLDASTPAIPSPAAIFSRRPAETVEYSGIDVSGDQLYAVGNGFLDIYDIKPSNKKTKSLPFAKPWQSVEEIPDLIVPSWPDKMTKFPTNMQVNAVSADLSDAVKNVAFACDGQLLFSAWRTGEIGMQTGTVCAVSLADLQNPVVTAELLCGGKPCGFALNRPAKMLYIVNGFDFQIVRYDGSGLLFPIASMRISEDAVSGPQAVAIMPDGNLVLACGAAGLKSVALNGLTNAEVVASFETDGFAGNLACDGNRLFVSDDTRGITTFTYEHTGSLVRHGTRAMPTGSANAVVVKDRSVFVATGELPLVALSDEDRPEILATASRPHDWRISPVAYASDVAIFDSSGVSSSPANVVAIADGHGCLLFYKITGDPLKLSYLSMLWQSPTASYPMDIRAVLAHGKSFYALDWVYGPILIDVSDVSAPRIVTRISFR